MRKGVLLFLLAENNSSVIQVYPIKSADELYKMFAKIKDVNSLRNYLNL